MTYIYSVKPPHWKRRATFGIVSEALAIQWRREVVIRLIEWLRLRLCCIGAFGGRLILDFIPRVDRGDGGAPRCFSRVILVARCLRFGMGPALHGRQER